MLIWERCSVSHSFQDLLELARQGEADALGQVLEASRNYLLAIANTTLNKELAAKGAGSDLVQETFLDAHRNFDRFEGERERDLLNWLREILTANLIDFRRAFRRDGKRDVDKERRWQDSKRGIQLSDGDPTPSKEVSNKEQSDRLESALARLPDEYQVVIEWHNRDHLKFTEIAELMDKSPDAVRMLWNRAVRLLKVELSNDALA